MRLRNVTGALAAVVLTLLIALAGAHPSTQAQPGRSGQQADDVRAQQVALLPVAQRLLPVLPDQADDALIPVLAIMPRVPSCGGPQPTFHPLPVVQPGAACPPARGPPGLAI